MLTTLPLLLAGCILTAPGVTGLEACLPDGIAATDVVSVRVVRKKVLRTTVAQTLTRLGAKCREGVLADAKGREIRFFRLEGCWANPPEDSKEILEEQGRRLAELKRSYTVVEMTCDPDANAVGRRAMGVP